MVHGIPRHVTGCASFPGYGHAIRSGWSPTAISRHSRRSRRAGNHLQSGFDFENIQDFLGKTTARHEDEASEWTAQLIHVRLMLQHGVPIRGPTREHALEPLFGPLRHHISNTDRQLQQWAVMLYNVLHDHCFQAPEDQRGEDITKLLRRDTDLKEAMCKIPGSVYRIDGMSDSE